MNLLNLQNKTVAVLGYGQEGKAVTEFLLKNGIQPVLYDQKPWQQWPETEQKAIKNLKLNFIFGPDCFKELGAIEIAFRSPGVPLLHPDLQLRLQYPNSKFILTSQTKFFFDNCPAKIIGITGTKGKGTTSALTYSILQNGLKNKPFKVFLTGNIGNVQPLEILNDLESFDWVVYELSSFQLQDLHKSPHIGVVLMVTQEHLDVHKNIEEYLEAKTAIVKFQEKQDFAIINKDFDNSMAIGSLGEGNKLYFSRKKTVGADCFIKDGNIVLNNSASQAVELEFPAKSLQLRGEHNLENVCASALAGHCVGVEPQSIIYSIINFKGLEHRLELAGEKNNIKYYNDSFSTTPETAMAAINSFTEPEILILGGSSKKSNFHELAKLATQKENIKQIILIGQEAPHIKKELLISGFKEEKIAEGAKNMAEIFAQIKHIAVAGDVVVLSPACASFDMFKNYKDRGQQFKKFVNK